MGPDTIIRPVVVPRGLHHVPFPMKPNPGKSDCMVRSAPSTSCCTKELSKDTTAMCAAGMPCVMNAPEEVLVNLRTSAEAVRGKFE